MEEYKKKRIFVKVRCELSRGITAAEIDENGHLVFTMSDGTTADMGLVVGEDGASITGIERTAVTPEANIYTVTMSDGTQFRFEALAATGAPGKDGADGKDGSDGVSPIVSVSQITGGHRVTVTDAEGKQQFDVMDGAAAEKGEKGDPGAPGASVTGIALSEQTGTQATYTVTMSDGSKFDFTVQAVAGRDGADGAPGRDGTDGQDGVSPQISVTDIDGGHRVTITDAEGTKSFDVMDGAGGGGVFYLNVSSISEYEPGLYNVAFKENSAAFLAACKDNKTILIAYEGTVYVPYKYYDNYFAEPEQYIKVPASFMKYDVDYFASAGPDTVTYKMIDVDAFEESLIGYYYQTEMRTAYAAMCRNNDVNQPGASSNGADYYVPGTKFTIYDQWFESYTQSRLINGAVIWGYE